LCFHHIDPSQKEFEIGNKDIRWSLIKIEIDKCILICQNCHREIHSKTIPNRKRKRINKQIFLEFKNSFECERCGYNKCNNGLDFHHISSKKFKINSEITLKNVNQLTQDLQRELDKCIVLCANCHRTEHFDFEKFNKYKEEILEKSKNIRENQKPLNRELVWEMYQSGMKQVDIAKHFNASKGTISDIIKKLKLLSECQK